MPQEPFSIIPSTSDTLPIVVSVPHSGTRFPDAVASEFKPQFVEHPEDTDWFVDQLYDFAPAMGVTVIHSVYSRYVVDLNRAPCRTPLYDDGRIITDIVPSHSFRGEALYKDERDSISTGDQLARLQAYYDPYHSKLDELLTTLQKTCKHVLLWEAHSILSAVPSIRSEPFPKLNLGDNHGKAADKVLSECALEELSGDPSVSFQHNNPFCGGYITRTFGKPERAVHALQLEMTQDMYMDESACRYAPERAERMRALLKSTFKRLAKTLRELE